MPPRPVLQNQRLTQTPSKETEGRHFSVKHNEKAAETKSERARGRPKGSRNKPKALIPKELASELLGVVKDQLPPEQYAEMRDAIRKGKNISTINEAKILMKLMGPPVWRRLVQESQVDPVEAPDMDPDLVAEIGASPKPKVQPFDKDLTERVKVLMSLIQLVDRMEKDDEATDNSAQPILEVFAGRGLGRARLEILTGEQSRVVGGDSDRVGGEGFAVRALPDSVSERSIDIPDSEQVETVRVFNDDILGDDPRSSDSE